MSMSDVKELWIVKRAESRGRRSICRKLIVVLRATGESSRNNEASN